MKKKETTRTSTPRTSSGADDSCVLIDLTSSLMFSRAKALPILSISRDFETAWIKLVLASAEAGATVRGRVITNHSFIVPSVYVEEATLKQLANHGLLKFKRVAPSARPRTKELAFSTAVSTPVNQTDSFIQFAVVDAFNKFWETYPARQGQKLRKADAKNWYLKSLTSQHDADRLLTAVENYKRSSAVLSGFTKDAINFLQDWESWVNYDPRVAVRGAVGRPTQAQINRVDDDKVIL
jgi:hypothetical protein